MVIAPQRDHLRTRRNNTCFFEFFTVLTPSNFIYTYHENLPAKIQETKPKNWAYFGNLSACTLQFVIETLQLKYFDTNYDINWNISFIYWLYITVRLWFPRTRKLLRRRSWFATVKSTENINVFKTIKRFLTMKETYD